MEPNVAIIILNWNGWRDTVECLESVYQIKYPNYNIIVVDNGSEDESIEKIKDYTKGELIITSDFFKYNHLNKPIKLFEYTKEEIYLIKELKKEYYELFPHKKLILIKNDNNYGFAEGNNIGIKYALNILNADYLLLLNNDTTVDKYFLNELIGVAETNEYIGILGPTIYDYNCENKIQSAGTNLKWKKGIGIKFRYNEIDNGTFEKIIEFDYVSGCAILIKDDVFKKIGYLNKNYFAYWEETDFCIRANNVGYKVVSIPKSKIWHKELTSTKKISGFHEYLLTRNMFWFMKKYSTNLQYLSFLFYFFGFRFWVLNIMYISKKNSKALKCFYKGIKDGVVDHA